MDTATVSVDFRVEGTVEAANKDGLKIKGSWYNYSKKPEFSNVIRTAQRGEAVVLGVVEGRYIGTLGYPGMVEFAGSPAGSTGGMVPQTIATGPAEFPAAGGPGPVPPAPAPAPIPPQVGIAPSRDASIVRQVAVKAAAEIVAANPAMTDEELEAAIEKVMQGAGRLEDWIQRRSEAA